MVLSWAAGDGGAAGLAGLTVPGIASLPAMIIIHMDGRGC